MSLNTVSEIPQSRDTERLALAFLLNDPSRAAERSTMLPDEMFNDLQARIIKHAIENCIAKGITLDVSSVGALIPKDDNFQANCVFLSDLSFMDTSKTKFEPVVASLQTLASKRTAGQEVFQGLALLNGLTYERVRGAEAKRLGVRVPFLDAEVEKCRAGSTQSTPVTGVDSIVPEIAPWDHPVDGSEVLSQVAQTFIRYVSLPKGAADALALWCAHTYALTCFTHSPRLNIRSAVKGSGKSTLRAIVGAMVARPVPAENATVGALFRLAELHSPTLLLDEVDAWLRDNEVLRGLLNAGHERNGRVMRCVGEDHQPRVFKVFCPVVLTGIGSLPGTLHDRSIVIEMIRALPGEIGHRFDSRHTEAEAELSRKLARFAADNRDKLESIEPQMPDNAFNRTADNWRPLFAIAQVAGGGWRERAENSFLKLNSSDMDDHGSDLMLLEDIREAFNGSEKLFTRDLLRALHSMADRPWNEKGKGGKPISENWLGRALKKFKVKSDALRISGERAKGYKRADLEDVFARYLPQPGLSTRDTVTDQAGVHENDFSSGDTESGCHGSEPQEMPVNIELSPGHGLIHPSEDQFEVVRGLYDPSTFSDRDEDRAAF